MKIKHTLGIFIIEDFVGMYDDLIIDIPDPFLCHLYFALSYGGTKGQKLSVDIGNGYFVVIHKSKASYSAPGQSLRHIGTYPAKTEHGDPGLAQFGDAFLSY